MNAELLALPAAETAWILRSVQKDEEYRDALYHALHEALIAWLPNQPRHRAVVWLRANLADLLGLFSDVAYYLLCVPQQTLGEEYCDLLQVQRGRTRRAALWQQVWMSLCYMASTKALRFVFRRVARQYVGRVVKDDALSSALRFILASVGFCIAL